jgi:hypothetical protein
MKILHSALVLYGCTFEQAFDLVHAYRLQNCEPVSWPIRGIWFSYEGDLLVFMLQFRGQINFEDHLAIMFPGQQEAVETFILEYEMGSRIERSDLVAVRFWDTKDQETFESALGL